MITRIFLHTDGERIAIELGDGDDGLLITNYAYDPPVTENVVTLEGDEWTQIGGSGW